MHAVTSAIPYTGNSVLFIGSTAVDMLGGVNRPTEDTSLSVETGADTDVKDDDTGIDIDLSFEFEDNVGTGIDIDLYRVPTLSYSLILVKAEFLKSGRTEGEVYSSNAKPRE